MGLGLEPEKEYPSPGPQMTANGVRAQLGMEEVVLWVLGSAPSSV